MLRWHALSGYSLALTQFTGGRVTLERGTGALLEAIAGDAPFAIRLEAPVAAVRRNGAEIEVVRVRNRYYVMAGDVDVERDAHRHDDHAHSHA